MTTRTIHGAYSDIKSKTKYEFAQTSNGNVFVNQYYRGLREVWQGLAIIKDINVFTVMNSIDVSHLWYSQGSSTHKYQVRKDGKLY